MATRSYEQLLPHEQTLSVDGVLQGRAVGHRFRKGRLLPEQIYFAGATVVGVSAGLYGGTVASIVAGAASGMVSGVLGCTAILLVKLYQALD